MKKIIIVILAVFLVITTATNIVLLNQVFTTSPTPTQQITEDECREWEEERQLLESARNILYAENQRLLSALLESTENFIDYIVQIVEDETGELILVIHNCRHFHPVSFAVMNLDFENFEEYPPLDVELGQYQIEIFISPAFAPWRTGAFDGELPIHHTQFDKTHIINHVPIERHDELHGKFRGMFSQTAGIHSLIIRIGSDLPINVTPVDLIEIREAIPRYQPIEIPLGISG